MGHPEYLEVLSKIAGLLDQKSDPQAEAVLRAVVGTAVANDDPKVASYSHNLALQLSKKGEAAQAESLFRAAISKSMEQENSRETARMLVEYGRLLLTLGRNTEAEVAAGTALDLIAASRLPDEIHADALLNLASVRGYQHAFEDAQELAIRALRLHQKRGIPGNPRVAAALEMVGTACLHQGDPKAAEGFYREAVAIRRDFHGNGHPNTAKSLTNLGRAVAAREDSTGLAEARLLLEEAVAINERSSSGSAYIALVDFGEVLLKAGCASEALAAFERAAEKVDWLRNRLGSDELDQAQFSTRATLWALRSGLIRARLAAQVNAEPEAFFDLEQFQARALLQLLARGGASSTNSHGARTGALCTDRLAERLSAHELLIAYEFGPKDLVVLVLRPDGSVTCTYATAADGSTISSKDITSSISRYAESFIAESPRPHGSTESEPPAASAVSQLGRGLRDALLPASTRAEVRAASRIFITLDGPLHAIPFECLPFDEAGRPWIEAGPPIVYGPSPTVLMVKREQAEKRRLAQAERKQQAGGNAAVERPVLVALGDPLFGDSAKTKDNSSGAAGAEPDHGMLVAAVQPESPAAALDLRAGDVLLTYNGQRLQKPADLTAAIAAAQPAQSTAPPSAGESGGPGRGAVESGGRGTDGGTENGDRAEADVPAPMRGDAEETYAAETRGERHSRGNASSDADAPPRSPPANGIRLEIWRDGNRLTLNAPPGKLGIRLSQLEMPEALRLYRDSKLDENTRLARLIHNNTRNGFGELQPLPGTRAEVNAIAERMKRRGHSDASVRLLRGPEATCSGLFAAADRPRFLHLATHGKIESGARVRESALALTPPAQLTPDDTGFLRLADLLERWGGKLDGTELVVLSGCQTARGRLDAAEGFVGLTWGFLYAGAETVVASLWKVDDGATALLMTRFYENLLGAYDEPRGRFAAKAEMPKADALHEAKRWLRSQTAAQNREALRAIGFDVPAPEPREARADAEGSATAEPGVPSKAETRRLPTGDPEPAAAPFDYSHPRYWAAFILIGNPE